MYNLTIKAVHLVVHMVFNRIKAVKAIHQSKIQNMFKRYVTKVLYLTENGDIVLFMPDIIRY